MLPAGAGGDTFQNGSTLPTSPENGPDRGIEDEAYGQFEEFFDAAEAKAMAAVLSTMMSPGSGLACLDGRMHARGRILWQQKVNPLQGYKICLH